MLKKISEQHHKTPVVIKQGNRISIYGHSCDTYRWQLNPLLTYSFQLIAFPCDYSEPKILPAASVTRCMLDAIRVRGFIDFSDYKGHADPWKVKSDYSADYCPHPGILRTIVKNADTEPLLVNDPGWGTEFVLSRGAASLCIAVYKPFGHCGYLGYRMEQDLKILKHIMEVRTAEREQKFQYATPENSFSFS